ncbi:MAG: FAD-dependent oxidoreductase [Pseudomonadota bacterium]
MGWTIGFFRNATQETYLKNSGKNARLAQYSIRAFRELTNELNFSFDRADQGTLKIYRDKTGLSDAVTVARRCAQWDIPFTVLDSKAVAELEPSLAPISHQLTGGIHFPEDISGDAHRFCAELAAVTDELGATFHYGTRVNEILKSHHSFRGIRLASGEEIEADACVVATGVGTPQILKPLGIRVPIEPVKGYSITVDIENWHPRPQRPIIDEHYHAAVCPLGQRLRVAGTAEFAGFDTQMRPARIQNLHHLIGELYPQAPNDTGTDNAWTGLRPMTPDGVGIMGESGLKGLYLNTGHGHLGWTMATGAGRALSELITERESRFDLADFSVERFTG